VFWIQLAQGRVKRRGFSTAVTYLRVVQNRRNQFLSNANGQRATSFQTNQTGRHSRCFGPPPSLALCAVTLCPSVQATMGTAPEVSPPNFSLLLSNHSTLLFGRQYVQPQTDYINKSIICTVCRDSSVGIVTRYGLDIVGIESRWEGGGDIFCTRPDRLWGPTNLPIQDEPGLFPGG